MQKNHLSKEDDVVPLNNVDAKHVNDIEFQELKHQHKTTTRRRENKVKSLRIRIQKHSDKFKETLKKEQQKKVKQEQRK